jgi:hypothetical protein
MLESMLASPNLFCLPARRDQVAIVPTGVV